MDKESSLIQQVSLLDSELENICRNAPDDAPEELKSHEDLTLDNEGRARRNHQNQALMYPRLHLHHRHRIVRARYQEVEELRQETHDL